MGEGAGVVVLEELEHAKARGAKSMQKLWDMVLQEMLSHHFSCRRRKRCSQSYGTCHGRRQDLHASQVDYINAHGTSTHHNDLFETRAIKKHLVMQAKDVDQLYKIHDRTSSGAAGAVEFITCVKTILEEGFIHQTVGTTGTGRRV